MFIKHQELKNLSITLAKIIKTSWYSPDIIVSISWWWLIPTYYISKWLDVRPIQNLSLHSYDGTTRTRIMDSTPHLEIYSTLKYLLIDDLVDWWSTLKFAKDLYFPRWNVKTATLFKKDKSEFIPDYYVQDVWDERIEFEYEQDL